MMDDKKLSKDEKRKKEKKKRKQEAEKKFRRNIILVGVGIVVWLVVMIVWNVAMGQPTLRYADDTYCARGNGPLAGHLINEKGTKVLKDLVLNRTRPAYNPAVIGYQFIRWNYSKQGYQLVIKISPCEEREGVSYKSYELYQSGSMLFLRRIWHGNNQVLHAYFMPEDVIKALEPYLEAR